MLLVGFTTQETTTQQALGTWEQDKSAIQSKSRNRVAKATCVLQETGQPQMDTSSWKKRVRHKRKGTAMFKKRMRPKLNLTIEIPSEFCQIIPGLYLGEVVSALNRVDLDKFNIKAVINCTTSQRNCFEDIDCFNIRVLDSGDPESVKTLSQALLPAAQFIHLSIKQGKEVLVHCHRGLSRSPTVIAAYLIAYENYSVEAALLFIKEKRFIKPREEFKELLYKFSKLLN